MWLSRYERFLKVTLLLEAQLQIRPLICGETIAASKPLSRRFIWSRSTFHATVLPARNLTLDAVLITEELVILLGIAH